jgi:glycosyltransferase involved in cell wall biosynthesis
MDLVRRLGLQDRVSFQGELPAAEVSGHLWEADVALLPFATGASTGRSSLMTILAHGLPVVTTNDAVNLPAEFQDGQNMVLAPAGDEEAFLAATRRVAEDATLRTRLSQGAMHLSKTLFAWPEIARQTLSLPAYSGLAR